MMTGEITDMLWVEVAGSELGSRLVAFPASRLIKNKMIDISQGRYTVLVTLQKTD